ncbi:unnamed protein product, partial [Mesorhabditis spiculigera]
MNTVQPTPMAMEEARKEATGSSSCSNCGSGCDCNCDCSGCDGEGCIFCLVIVALLACLFSCWFFGIRELRKDRKSVKGWILMAAGIPVNLAIIGIIIWLCLHGKSTGASGEENYFAGNATALMEFNATTHGPWPWMVSTNTIVPI